MKRSLRASHISIPPIAAWLCNSAEPWNDEFRRWILEAQPEIHLVHGDPVGLPIDYKRKVLLEIIRRSANHRRSFIETSIETMGRLADPKLADTIAALIENRTLPVDLRTDGLLLARAGGIKACAEVAARIALNDTEFEVIKASAISVVAALGAYEEKSQLIQAFFACERIPQQVACEIIVGFFPTFLQASAVAELLEKIEPSVAVRTGFTLRLEYHFQELSTDHAVALLRELLRMIRKIESNPGWIIVPLRWSIWPSPVMRSPLTLTISPGYCETLGKATRQMSGARH
jgi:hypothetical protein